MKKKGLIVAILCVTVLLIAAAGIIGYGLRSGIDFSEATYIQSLHGPMLLLDGSPISMSGKDSMFEGLTTGDKVLVAHSPIAESYPGQAKAYLCIKRSDGSEADIPGTVTQSLVDMGWLQCDCPPTQPDDTPAAGKEVTYAYGCVTMSLLLPDDWTYRIVEATDDGNQYGIECMPPNSEHSIALYAYPEGVGFCGTGLEFKNTTVAGYAASVAYATDGDAQHLAHVYFTDIPGDFVLLNQGVDWQLYGEEGTQIAESVQIRVDTLTQDEAQGIAEEQIDWEYYSVTHQLDHQSGDWTVTFWSKDREYFTVVTVSAHGQILSVALPEHA